MCAVSRRALLVVKGIRHLSKEGKAVREHGPFNAIIAQIKLHYIPSLVNVVDTIPVSPSEAEHATDHTCSHANDAPLTEVGLF